MDGDKRLLYQYGLSRKKKIISIDHENCKIKYAISTLPGQSGSPVIFGENIIALHTGSGATEKD
jgi:V8-like Glu-specific endopeptidase